MNLIAAVAVAVLSAQGSEPTGFLTKALDYNGAPVKYVVYVPAAYDPAKPMPAIMFLHGAGETGTDGLKQVAVGLGPAILFNQDRWPFLVMFPQKPPGGEPRSGWIAHEKLVLDILEKTKTEYKIDESRLYLTGLSMGGYGTWAIAAKHPDRFAAIAPICGGGDPATAGKLKDIPTWNFHGDKDTAVPLARSQQMIDAIKAAGGEPRFTIYPGVGHNSWDKAYRDEKLHEWFLQHKKGK